MFYMNLPAEQHFFFFLRGSILSVAVVVLLGAVWQSEAQLHNTTYVLYPEKHHNGNLLTARKRPLHQLPWVLCVCGWGGVVLVKSWVERSLHREGFLSVM